MVSLCRSELRVDFSIPEVPRHILVTTPVPQHTQCGVMETVSQGQTPLLVKSGLVSGTGFSSFRSRHLHVSAAPDTVAAVNALVQWLSSKQRGPVCAWGSAADQTLSHQPLFAQLPPSEKSPEVIGCPVQFAPLSLGWQSAPMLKHYSGAMLPPFVCVADTCVTAHRQIRGPERPERKLDSFSWSHRTLWLVLACGTASKPALPWKCWIHPLFS